MAKLYLRQDLKVLRFSHQVDSLLSGLMSNSLDLPLNAFLDFAGRIIVVCSCLRNGKDMLIVLGSKFEERLMEHLKKYLLLTGTKIKDESFFVYHDLEGGGTGQYCIPQLEGQLILMNEQVASSVTKKEYMQFRLDHNLPIQGQDFDQEMILNVFGKSHVSFTKGCFLGQEIVARVKNLAKPPLQLVVQDGKFVFVRT
jgi:folate-binding protein YgfZ